MEGLELLAISLSILFGFGMIFSILLWCRSWRKEDREQTEQQINALRTSVRKLTEAVDLLDHTAASLQSADGLLTQQLEDLRSSITRLQGVRTTEPASTPEPATTAEPTPATQPALAVKTAPAESSVAEGDAEADTESGQPGSYDDVADLLKQGKSTVEIARTLDIGVAEVRMIARMRAAENPREPA